MSKGIGVVIHQLKSVVTEAENFLPKEDLWWKLPWQKAKKECYLKDRVSNNLYLLRLAKIDLKDKIVLDAGCGAGLDLFIFYFLGAKKVFGLDINKEEIDFIEKLKSKLGLNSLIVSCADAANLHFSDESIDLIFCHETISHINNVDGFFKEAKMVLKREGVLLISDANNLCNPYIRYKTYKIWNCFENGPPRKNIFGHRVLFPYTEARKRVIRDCSPNLNEKEVELLAKATSGKIKDEIIEAVKKYLEEKELPKNFYHYGNPPIEPLSGSYIERLFNPKDLVNRLSSFGFNSRYYAFFTGRTILKMINPLFLRSSPISIYLARSFIIIAKKK
ncbi:MAG: class I SAM-dependent methyltransferase [Candidatus Omnitrophica bacterium]|nr:class I SAM-dependent methyltransferase [Candidatus Omnitrophota bacterium]